MIFFKEFPCEDKNGKIKFLCKINNKNEVFNRLYYISL